MLALEKLQARSRSPWLGGLLLLLTACEQPTMVFQTAVKGPLSDEDILKITDFKERSVAAFQAKVHPQLKKTCGGCHRAEPEVLGRGYPHSDPNIELAHDTVIANDFVNFAELESSRFLEVALGDHLTVVSVPAMPGEVFAQFKSGLESWAELRGTDPNAVIKTAEVELPRVPASGSVPLQTLPTTPTSNVGLDLGALMSPALVGDTAPRMTFEVDHLNGLYRIRNLRFKNPVPLGEKAVRVSSIRVYLNGKLIPQASGFDMVNLEVPRTVGTTSFLGTTIQQQVMLYPDCAVDAPAACKDRLSFSFGIVALTEGGPFGEFKILVQQNCSNSSCHGQIKNYSVNGVTGVLPAFGSIQSLVLEERQYQELFRDLPGDILRPGDAQNSVLYQVLLPTSAQTASGVSTMPSASAASLSLRTSMQPVFGAWINSLTP